MTATFSNLIAAAAPMVAIFLAGCVPQPRVADSSAVTLPAQPQRQENSGVLMPPLRFSFDSVRQRSQQRLQAFLEARNSETTLDPCPVTDRMKTWTPPPIPPVPMPNAGSSGSGATPMPNAWHCAFSQPDSLTGLRR